MRDAEGSLADIALVASHKADAQLSCDEEERWAGLNDTILGGGEGDVGLYKKCSLGPRELLDRGTLGPFTKVVSPLLQRHALVSSSH